MQGRGLGAVWIQPLRNAGCSKPGTYIFILRAVQANWKECARLYKEGVREPKSMLRASWGINSSAEAAGHHATHPAAAETCFLQSGLPQVRNKIIPGNPLSLGLASFYSWPTECAWKHIMRARTIIVSPTQSFTLCRKIMFFCLCRGEVVVSGVRSRRGRVDDNWTTTTALSRTNLFIRNMFKQYFCWLHSAHSNY